MWTVVAIIVGCKFSWNWFILLDSASIFFCFWIRQSAHWTSFTRLIEHIASSSPTSISWKTATLQRKKIRRQCQRAPGRFPLSKPWSRQTALNWLCILYSSVWLTSNGTTSGGKRLGQTSCWTSAWQSYSHRWRSLYRTIPGTTTRHCEKNGGESLWNLLWFCSFSTRSGKKLKSTSAPNGSWLSGRTGGRTKFPETWSFVTLAGHKNSCSSRKKLI